MDSYKILKFVTFEAKKKNSCVSDDPQKKIRVGR